jgi:hypothetical protein
MKRPVKHFKVTSFKYLIPAILFFAVSCADGGPNEAHSDDSEMIELTEDLDMEDSKRALLVESIIRSSPTIAESGQIFGEIGSDFERDLLNDIENVSNYVTIKDQGLNLGIYLADLGYITAFEQSQELIFYMNCAQKMAEGIGVNDIFTEETVERMEMNMNDKDSIIALISEMYWKTDAFLKELGKENISALIICGGWVEGMHIGAQILESNEESIVIYQKIMSQRRNLIKIISLLETFEGDDNIDYYRAKLKDIENDYSSIGDESMENPSDDQKEKIKMIAQKIEAIRQEMATV